MGSRTNLKRFMKTPSDPSDDHADWINSMLHEHTAEYLPDENFSHRVLAALPPPRKLNSRRPLLIATATAGGTLIAVLLGGPNIPSDLARMVRSSAEWCAVPIFNTPLSAGVIGLLALSGWLAYAAWRSAWQ